MSAVWFSAAFCVLLAAGGTWAAWPLLAAPPALPGQEEFPEPENAEQLFPAPAPHWLTSSGLYANPYL
jgi:hypothetical protein